MRRRFLIAKALVHKPKILILDEPTAGVDIEMRHTLYDFLVKLHESGTTIILTTHYIEEAEKLCKRIVIIDGGKIIADEPKEELMDAFSRESIIEVHFEDELSLADFDFLSDYHPHIEDKTRLQLKASKKDLSKVFRQLSEKNMEFTNLVVERPKLEDIYLNIIKRSTCLMMIFIRIKMAMMLLQTGFMRLWERKLVASDFFRQVGELKNAFCQYSNLNQKMGT